MAEATGTVKEAAGKRRALGKGLESLLPKAAPRIREEAPAAPLPPDGRAFEIDVEKIDRNPYQTRTHFDVALLEELAGSIRAVGVIQPILVRAIADGRYQLVAGERRWLASKKAGKATIPAVVAVLNDAQAMEATIIENLQRADLNPMEQARAFDRLGREFRMTQDQMAVRTGKDRASISNFLRLLRLPEQLQLQVEAGGLTFGHARALLALENHEQMARAAQKIMALSMSVRQAETFVRGSIDPERRAKKLDRMDDARDPNVREMENTLRRALGMRVTIEDKKGRGRLVVEYSELNEFDKVVDRLVGNSSL